MRRGLSALATAVAVEALPASTDANASRVLRREATIASTLTNQLDTITAPSAKRTTYRSFRTSMRRQITLARRLATAVDHRRPATTATLVTQLNRESAKSNHLATSIKLTDCAKDYLPAGSGGSPV